MSRNRIRCYGRRAALAVALAAALAGVAAPSVAQRGETRPDLDLELVQSGPVSLEEAIEIARRRFGGQVVSAETRVEDGREVHVIRIIEGGRVVRTVQIDAATGRLRR